MYVLIPSEQVLDMTEQLCTSYINDPDSAQEVFQTYVEHLAQALSQQNLHVTPEVNDYIVELEWVIEEEVKDSPEYIRAQLMATGRLLYLRAVYDALDTKDDLILVDPRDIIVTDEVWVHATIDFNTSMQKWIDFSSPAKPILTTCGLGSSKHNENTLTAPERYWEGLLLRSC